MPRLAKPPSQRQRRNRTTAAATIDAAPAERVELASWFPDDDLHSMTTRTWDVWWASPLRTEWVDADVPDLVALALMVDAFWKAAPVDRPKIHSEIRMASREFGLTPMSRRGLQWEIRKLEPSTRRPAADPPSRRATRSTLSVLEGKAG